VSLGVFAAVAGLSLLTKYVLRYRGAPIFNPSNAGLVAAFVLLGSSRVEPLDFWWAPLNAWMVLAYAVILTGGLLITRQLGLISLAAAFWVTLTAGVGLLAASGHCITANWAFAPVCGVDFWRVIATSPEVLIFLFFMITDPRTVPAGRVGRIVFGVLVGAIGTLLLAPQTTEFESKVGLLAGLTLVCAARPLLERFVPRPNSADDAARAYLGGITGFARGASARFVAARLGAAAVGVAALAAGIVIAGTPAHGATRVEAELPEIDASRMDPGTFPTISVDTAVTDWDPALTGSAMRDILLTSAQNLEVENEALLRAEPSLLTQVDHGDRLDQMQARISTAVDTGTTRIDRYAPQAVEVTLLRPFGKQDGLSLGLRAHGIVSSETYDASGGLQARTSAPFSLTFVVRRATGARWLNVAVLPGEADPVPAP